MIRRFSAFPISEPVRRIVLAINQECRKLDIEQIFCPVEQRRSKDGICIAVLVQCRDTGHQSLILVLSDIRAEQRSRDDRRDISERHLLFRQRFQAKGQEVFPSFERKAR